MRRNVKSLSYIGSIEKVQCNGSTSHEPYGGALAVSSGIIKSALIRSDGLRPTDYQCVWVNNQPGHYQERFPGVLCSVPPPGKSYYTEWKTKIMFASNCSDIPGFYSFNGISGTQLPVAHWNIGGIHNAVTMGMLGKIRDQKLSLGVTAGEAKESANLLLDLVEDTLSVVRYIRNGVKRPGEFIQYMLTKPKGRPLLNGKPHWPVYAKAYDVGPLTGRKIRNKRKFSKLELRMMGVTSQAMANRWLQLRYGVYPLYNDILKIMDELIAAADEKPLYSARVTIKLPDLGLGFPGSGRVNVAGKVKGFQQMKIWYEAKDLKLRKMLQYGLHPYDALSIAWELTPFSFMIDWLYPIGDSLEALNATRGLTFAFGYNSQKYEVVDCKTMSTNSGVGSSKVTSDFDDAATSTFGAFQRRVITGFPLVRFPVVENPFGIHTGQRITDVVALIRQAFK